MRKLEHQVESPPTAESDASKALGLSRMDFYVATGIETPGTRIQVRARLDCGTGAAFSSSVLVPESQSRMKNAPVLSSAKQNPTGGTRRGK